MMAQLLDRAQSYAANITVRIKSVLQYLTGLRMETARELLLRDGETTVNEVAEKVGYQFAHHFIRPSRKEFGYTLGQLRKSMRHGTSDEIVAALVVRSALRMFEIILHY